MESANNTQSNYTVGESYKVLELAKYKGNLKVSERKLREVGKDEVLIKVMCSTIHPADISFLSGTYGSDRPDVPLIPGFEGSGLVIKAGENVDSSLVGKRCGIFVNSSKKGLCEGLWAQYHYTSPVNLMVFDTEVDYETICFALGNPLTACGFLDTIRKKGANCVGHNGASSSFGKIFTKLCAKEGVKTISTVRKAEHVETLKSCGGDYVFNTSDPNWQEDFKKVAEELNVQNFFECVGGDMTGIVLGLLPSNSTLYHFGNLALKRLAMIDTSDFIFKKKLMRGWWLLEWMLGLTKEEAQYWKNYIVNDIQSGSDLFKTKVAKSFPLEEVEKAFEVYMTDMSGGKIVLKPNN